MFNQAGTTIVNIDSRSGSSRDTYFNQGGNVGIGTAGPSSKLQVEAVAGQATTLNNSVANSALRINADTANGSNNIRIGESGSGSYFLQVSNSAGTTPYAINLNPFGGNVGIGTDSPSSKLVVRTSTDHNFEVEETGGELRLSALNNARSANIGLQFAASEFNFLTGNVGIGTTSPSQKLHVVGKGLFTDDIQLTQTSPRIDYGNTTAGALRFFSVDANSEKMRITSEGGILINATSSGYGPVSYGYMLGIQGSATQSFMSMNYAGGALDTQGMIIGCDSVGALWLHRENKSLRLYTNNTERMSVQGGGDVIINNKAGIGNTNPYSLLDVNGVITNRTASEDPNFTVNAVGMSTIGAGSLQFTQGFGGTSSAGDTVVFRYNAVSWKSWSLDYTFSAANGGLVKGTIAGYNNNGGGGSNGFVKNDTGCTVVATNSGQNVIVTFTANFGIHPMCDMRYSQSGGDGFPRADRASLTFNS